MSVSYPIDKSSKHNKLNSRRLSNVVHNVKKKKKKKIRGKVRRSSRQKVGIARALRLISSGAYPGVYSIKRLGV